MPTYDFFGATADDVLRHLPPDTDRLAPSRIEAAMAEAEARIEAALPERYRRLLRFVQGEVIVRAATDGQASATVGLPAASGLVLYADLTGPYADRTRADEMPASAYELDEDGETITFSPALARGTRVAADYATTLARGVRVLAELVAFVAAAELARTTCHGRPDLVERLLRDADARLALLADGATAVPELDALALYDDWERAPRGIRAGELVRS